MDIEQLLEKANQGDADAMYQAGRYYEEEEYLCCVDWYEKAYAAGSADAALHLAALYSNESIIPPNEYMRDMWLDRAVQKAIEKAEKNQDTDLLFDIAEAYFYGNDGFPKNLDKSMEYFSIAGKNGSVTAAENVGVFYMYPEHGFTTNYDKAIEWFEFAAKKGSRKSINNLRTLYQSKYGDDAEQKLLELHNSVADEGYCIGLTELFKTYFFGEGVPIDEQKAIETLMPAVEAEYPMAIGYYGYLLYNGCNAMAADKVKAEEYLRKGAEYHDGLATETYGRLLMENQRYEEALQYMVPVTEEISNPNLFALIAEAYAQVEGTEKAAYGTNARAYYEKAALTGHKDANFELALSDFITGKEKECQKWIENGIKYESIGCLNLAGEAYTDGAFGFTKNPELGFKYYLRACELGNARGADRVAYAYEDGVGVAMDGSKAVEYYQKSADLGYVPAIYHLGYMYAEGNRIPADHQKAIELFKSVLSHPNASDDDKDRSRFDLALIYGKDGKFADSKLLYDYLIENSKDEETRGKSANNLAVSYAQGIGINVDNYKAKHYFEIAIANNYNVNVLKGDLETVNARIANSKPASKGGCYIATAVYQSYDCPEVWTLRRFRDNTLAPNFFGRLFIRVYYAVSPTLVKIFGENQLFQNFWKKHLDQIVKELKKRGVSDAPYVDREF